MKLSVVIPVYNGGSDLQLCLEALLRSTRPPDEVIVVDDASSDGSAELAAGFGSVISSQSREPFGPARARNLGSARAQGDILLFLDADVTVHANTLALIERHFSEHPETAALFGSYDDQPPHRSLVSLYKNLQHHFVHHHSQADASTFWTGVGAIRREVFLRLGGFDESYGQPSIEDIELGVRLKAAGYRIRLCPDVQVTHLKRWTLLSMLRTDILNRAIPWTRLIFSTAQLPADLNLDWRSRASAVCVWGMLFLSILGLWAFPAWAGAFALMAFVIVANFPLYRFFYRQGGAVFTAGAVLLHFFYYFYSSLTFGLLWVEHLLTRKQQKARVSYGSTGQ
ncbi:MAG TPA: glycosyltransferase family 2 protein [Anaerolineales bacterium]|nr:glycosyltransferase family 2 protein [Anaerolineales bacterium]